MSMKPHFSKYMSLGKENLVSFFFSSVRPLEMSIEDQTYQLVMINSSPLEQAFAYRKCAINKNQASPET
jgi:hypothetical protein